MYTQVCRDTCVWDQYSRVDVCLLHRENLRDARDGGGEGGTVHAHAGEDLLTSSHVTFPAVALTGGKGGRKNMGTGSIR